jgi:hypothetical protein
MSAPAHCAVPIKRLHIRLPTAWGQMSWSDLRLAWERGLALWTSVVDLYFEIERDPDETHIAPTYQRIDGSGKVLAWSEFPCPWNPPINQRYDSSEPYHTALGSGNGISLPLLVAHEIGHALGLGHGPQGNVMAPYLDDTLTHLGPWDLQEILARYDPVEPPEQPVTGEIGVAIGADGRVSLTVDRLTEGVEYRVTGFTVVGQRLSIVLAKR